MRDLIEGKKQVIFEGENASSLEKLGKMCSVVSSLSFKNGNLK